MLKNPKVSIIVPVYNGEKTLKQCLTSVLKQNYKNYEVIVVDNNSTDRTKEIIKEFQRKSKKIRYVFEEKIGRGAARNTGEKKAKGEIILMTDGDCIVPKNWVKNMIKPILDKVCDAVQGSEIDIKDGFWSRQTQLRVMEKIKNEELIIGRIDQKNFAISREALKKIGFTSRKYFSGMDTELAIRFQKNNLKLKFLKNIKVEHFHANSLKEVFKKQIYRAKWTAIISRENKNFLKKTDFLKDTCQTPWTFFRFFPGLIGTTIRKGFKYAFYELITGISWRIGLVYGWLKR